MTPQDEKLAKEWFEKVRKSEIVITTHIVHDAFLAGLAQARAETQPGRGEYGLEMYAMLVKLWGQGSVDIHKGVLPFELWKELDSLLAKLDPIYSDAYCGEAETLLTSPAPETGKRDV